MTAGLPWVPSPFFTRGRRQTARLICVHSVESAIKSGIAIALARGFFQNTAGTSAQTIHDQDTEAEMVGPDDTSWSVGAANALVWSLEFAGRASFNRAEWTTPEALRMLRRGARYAAAIARAYAIPARWLSREQMLLGEAGFCSHNDCRLAFGGTTHTDPGQWFPYDLFLQMVREELGLAPATTRPTALEELDMAQFIVPAAVTWPTAKRPVFKITGPFAEWMEDPAMLGDHQANAKLLGQSAESVTVRESNNIYRYFSVLVGPAPAGFPDNFPRLATVTG